MDITQNSCLVRTVKKFNKPIAISVSTELVGNLPALGNVRYRENGYGQDRLTN